MSDTPTMLHMMCGKIASGKSTLARQLAEAEATVLLVEDDWLSALYPDELTSGADYLRCSARLRTVMAPHVAALIGAGVSVVLDFPANTPDQRGWMRDVLRATGARHRLHLLEASDALCLARLKARNAGDDHPFAVTEARFHRFTRHFTPPTPEEGFEVALHPQTA